MEYTVKIIDESPGKTTQQVHTLKLVSERLTVQRLIETRIRDEVERFNAANEYLYTGLVQPDDAEQTLNGYKLRKRRKLDWKRQAALSIEAFQNRGFIMLIDDHQVEDLKEIITLTPTTAVTFIKLVPLVGG